MNHAQVLSSLKLYGPSYYGFCEGTRSVRMFIIYLNFVLHFIFHTIHAYLANANYIFDEIYVCVCVCAFSMVQNKNKKKAIENPR